MTESTTSQNRLAREKLYLERGEEGKVFGREFTFYPGDATIPNSYTGNLVLGASSNGPGANLIDGVGPVLTEEIPCDEPVIESLFFIVFVEPPGTGIIINYNAQEDDIIQMFVPGTGDQMGFKFVSITPGVSATVVLQDDPPSGLYTLKIMRASDPAECFTIRPGVYLSAGSCTLSVSELTFAGGAPIPGGIFAPNFLNDMELNGAGFLDCPVDLVIDRIGGGGPLTLTASDIVVVNDNLITFDLTVPPSAAFSSYEVTVFCTDDPTCEATAPQTLFFFTA